MLQPGGLLPEGAGGRGRRARPRPQARRPHRDNEPQALRRPFGSVPQLRRGRRDRPRGGGGAPAAQQRRPGDGEGGGGDLPVFFRGGADGSPAGGGDFGGRNLSLVRESSQRGGRHKGL